MIAQRTSPQQDGRPRCALRKSLLHGLPSPFGWSLRPREKRLTPFPESRTGRLDSKRRPQCECRRILLFPPRPATQSGFEPQLLRLEGYPILEKTRLDSTPEPPSSPHARCRKNAPTKMPRRVWPHLWPRLEPACRGNLSERTSPEPQLSPHAGYPTNSARSHALRLPTVRARQSKRASTPSHVRRAQPDRPYTQPQPFLRRWRRPWPKD